MLISKKSAIIILKTIVFTVILALAFSLVSIPMALAHSLNNIIREGFVAQTPDKSKTIILDEQTGILLSEVGRKLTS